MTQMTIHMYKVNLYMKYQSAVEILSMLASRVYCLKMPLNTVFVSSIPLKRARWPPIFIAILDPTWLVEYLCQVSLQIYGRFFIRGVTLKTSIFPNICHHKRQYFELLVPEIQCRYSTADLCAQIFANMLNKSYKTTSTVSGRRARSARTNSHASNIRRRTPTQ